MTPLREMIFMSKIKTLDDPEAILKKVEDGLYKGARDFIQVKGDKIIKDLMSETIDEKVYNNYSPKKYTRRGTNHGGLGDKKNMKSTTKASKQKRQIDYKLINKTPRHELKNFKSSQDEWQFNDITTDHDFLYTIKDEGLVYNLWNAPSYEQWGNGGKPLYLNKTLHEKVCASDQLKSGIRNACIEKAKKIK